MRTVLVESSGVDALIEHPLVAAVTLTGSVQAGKAVAAKAGAVLKKTVLELGGSDAYIVLEDCDVELAAAACAKARLINSGQSCIAAKRFVVVEPVHQAFVDRLVAAMEAERPGDPTSEATTIGPLARRDLREDLHSQVLHSAAMGARIITGGKIPKGRGWFYPPTVLVDANEQMPVCQEETFGPVAAVLRVRDEREAIRVANATVFGLGAAVFTRDNQRGEHIAADQLEAGSCFVNDFVKSDPRLPFGGIKQSGFGRELSVFGIREFVNVKTVYVK
jgi:succinate-semialdehyde dehydrogenase/glutarate-semialdehyde dehydrogenase